MLMRYWKMAHDPRTPAAAKWLLYASIAYLVAPIDFAPDWIPIAGLLDDALFVPALVGLATVLIPAEVKKDGGETPEEASGTPPRRGAKAVAPSVR
jgi:uncharacterized membrane protein YkvA (DUF1232 family)